MKTTITMIAISGAQVSSLCNDFGMERVLDNCVLPQTPTGSYGWKLTAFGRAVVDSCPPRFAGCFYTAPKWHAFEPTPGNPEFCRRCSFPAVEHNARSR